MQNTNITQEKKICEKCQCSTCLNTIHDRGKDDCYNCEICFEQEDEIVKDCPRYYGKFIIQSGLVRLC